MIIGVDFDGTCVVGYPDFKNCGAGPVLRELCNKGFRLVLNTCRAGRELELAVNWFKKENIELWGINSTPGQEKHYSTKVVADLYIDDRSFGAPLLKNEYGVCIDWTRVIDAMCVLPIAEKEALKDLVRAEQGYVRSSITRMF